MWGLFNNKTKGYYIYGYIGLIFKFTNDDEYLKLIGAHRFILIFQLPLLGSCATLKLSNDIPKLPKIEFPKSFSLERASSFIFAIFASCASCNRDLEIIIQCIHF